jgi:hypothetical protein
LSYRAFRDHHDDWSFVPQSGPQSFDDNQAVLSAKIEIKQTASLIAQMNRLPNSLVGSRLEQRRW